MSVKSVVDQINEELSKHLENTPFTDTKENVKSIVHAIFNKLDLVTREEFDTQKHVLAKTRQKLEELELKLKNK